MKAKAKPTLEAIAARIDVHLKKMESVRKFYKPTAKVARDGVTVRVKYLSYAPSQEYFLGRKHAEKYMAWLDAGNTGEHWKVI